MRVTLRGRPGAGGVVACIAVLALSLAAAPAGAAKAGKVTIKRTTGGIPNITAKNYRGAGYGYGYAFAEDNICKIADYYVTVACRSRPLLRARRHLRVARQRLREQQHDSDLFYQRIIDRGIVEDLLSRPPPVGPLPELKRVSKATSPATTPGCATPASTTSATRAAAAPWVKPIAELDAYRRFYQLALLASQTVAVDGIAGETPPTPAASRAADDPGEVSEPRRR